MWTPEGAVRPIQGDDGGSDHVINNGGPAGAKTPKEHPMHIFKTEAVANFIRARFAQAERGAALVEYALLVALIAVVSIVALNTLGGGIRDKFTDVNDCLSNTDTGCQEPAPAPAPAP